MLYLLVLLNICFIFIILSIIYQKVNVVNTLVLTVSFFFIIYCIISGVLWLFDCFTFSSALATQSMFLLAVMFFALWQMKKQKPELLFDVKQDLWPIILIVVLLPFTWNKFELYTTEQDQGLYQAEAIELYMGNFDVQHDFEEFQILENDEDKAAYKAMTDLGMPGYYPLSLGDWPTYSQEDIKSDVSGMYHGVQTYPSMLGLWARLFGLSQMLGLHTVFYICTIIIIYYIILELGIEGIDNCLLVLLLGLSPLFLWISKSFFVEMFLTMVITVFLSVLMEREKRIQWLLGVPLLAFAYSHVSYIIILPAFVVMNLVLFLRTHNYQYIIGNFVAAIGLASGYYMMSVIAPQYFYHNCSGLYIQNIITKENLLQWIFIVAILIIVLSYLISRLPKKLCQLCSDGLLKKMCIIITILSLIVMLIHGIRIGFFMSSEGMINDFLFHYYGSGIYAFQHLVIYSLAMATGFLIIPYNLFCLIKKSEKLCADIRFLAVGILYLYLILLQAAFIRKEVFYYYYYSRYLTFYLPLIIVLTAIFIKSNRKTIRLISILSIVPMLWFSGIFIKEKDDTAYTWEILEGLQNAVVENSAIILANQELIRTIGPQLRAVSQSAIFPVFDNIENEIKLLSENYNNIYYLTNINITGNDSTFIRMGSNNFDIEYKDHYIKSEMKLDSSNGLYPKVIEKEKKEVSLYRYRVGEPIMTIPVDDPLVQIVNGDKVFDYILSNGNAGIVVYGPYRPLEAGTYMLKVGFEIMEYKSVDIGTFISYNGSEQIIVPESSIAELLNYTGRNYIEVPFELDKYVDAIEFVFVADEGSKFKLTSYEIYQLNEYQQ